MSGPRHIRLLESGRVYITKALYQEMGTPEYVELLHDEGYQTVGLAPSSAAEDDAYKVNNSDSSNRRMLTMTAFIKAARDSVQVPCSIPMEWDADERRAVGEVPEKNNK
jgi:hypothetical protein